MTEANLFSGEFCADLLTILERTCSHTEAGDQVNKEQLKQELMALVDRHELELPVKQAKDVDIHGFQFRSTDKGVPITDADRIRLNALLPWSSYNFLGQGKGVLGGSFNNSKRYGGQPLPDPMVKELDHRLNLAGRNVLEAGCFEGHHSISLATHGAQVWAFDSRIENIIKSIARAWYFGVEQKITFELINLEQHSVAAFYGETFRSTPLFLFHSRGVLYHLRDPISHLLDAAKLQPEHIYLHTQIASEEMANEVYDTPLGAYKAFRYREKKISVSPFSGMENHSLWLTEQGLNDALSALGYANMEILMKKDERNGPRIELLATRTI